MKLIEYVDKLLIQNVVYPEEILNGYPLDVMMQGSSYLIKNFINSISILLISGIFNKNEEQWLTTEQIMEQPWELSFFNAI